MAQPSPAIRTSLGDDVLRVVEIANGLDINIEDWNGKLTSDRALLDLIDKLKSDSNCRMPDESGFVIKLYALEKDVHDRQNALHRSDLRIIAAASERFGGLDPRIASCIHAGQLSEIFGEIMRDDHTTYTQVQAIRRFMRQAGLSAR